MHIAGVIILYNPEQDVFNNIVSYLGALDCLFVVDNSEQPNEELIAKIKELPRIEYISFGKNTGISYALNTVLRLSDHYEFLLTMDQDSRFAVGVMNEYKRMIKVYHEKDKSVAMFSVNYEEEGNLETEVRVVERAITSGSIVNIQIAKALGGFDEKLFIDEVDAEFCYRARLNGYKIINFIKIHMQHHLGSSMQVNKLGFEFTVWNHSAIRKYYIIRNSIYLMKKYPDYRAYYIKAVFKFFIKTILAERDRKNKIHFMYKGIRDAVTGKMGELENT